MTRIPKGFRSIRPLSAEDARSRMREVLETAQEAAGMVGKIRVFRNADGSVDGELLFSRIPKSLGIGTLAFRTRQVFSNRIPGMYIQTGLRFSLDRELSRMDDKQFKQRYDYRYRGMGEAGTYFRLATPSAILDVFGAKGASMIAENMRERKRNKAEQMFVRLHWNPEGKKPARRPGKHRRTT